ncbi:MAG: hypothetical protein WC919_02520 [Candidatus Paceibacterota bacterium]|jgi:hypothetical protein
MAINLQDRPRNWILGGIVFIAIGSYIKTSGLLEVLFMGMALGGWVCLMIGIVKFIKSKRKKA